MLQEQQINNLIKMENLIGKHAKRLFCDQSDVKGSDGQYNYTLGTDPDTGVNTDDFNEFMNLIETLIRGRENAKSREFAKDGRLFRHETDGGAVYYSVKNVPNTDEGDLTGAIFRTDGNEIEVNVNKAAELGINIVIK